MPWELSTVLLSLPVFALIVFRVSGLFLTAPVFGSRAIPARIRVAMMMVVSFMMFPLLSTTVPQTLTMGQAIVGGIGELMIGATMGLALSAFLAAADLAGLVVGQQAGIVLGQIVDPTQGNRSSIIGRIYSISLTTVFLLMGGHRATLAALLDTYRIIPIGGFKPGEPSLLLLIEMLTAAFILGIRIAAPVLIALFLIGLAMGFLSRTMPQFNILTVGFSVRALAAMGTAGVALAACEGLFADAVMDALNTVRESFGVTDVVVGRGT